MSSAGEVIATGANDVPSPRGGLYWPDDPDDKRDYVKGYDSNKLEIDLIAKEIAQRVCPPGANKERLDEVQREVLRTRLSDLTEFGRPVHAEMEALMHCVRVGVSAVKGVMYVTTFPCHNCAKHIIAAGIKTVFFVEPYPKSRALHLHDDAAVFGKPDAGKVAFVPFVGVAARRYFDLFSLKLSSGRRIERKKGTRKKKFTPQNAIPRVPMSLTSVVDREKIATQIIGETMGSD